MAGQPIRLPFPGQLLCTTRSRMTHPADPAVGHRIQDNAVVALGVEVLGVDI